MVLAAAAVLGALSFFEPCTIATHTLFSVRSHARRGPGCGRELLALWGARSLLSVALLFVPLALTTPFRFGACFPSVALAVIASVYLVSRFVYIPVPHLEFWKLLPGGAVYPQAVKLGLTLPACTLPLFIIVAVVTAAHGSWLTALAAGLLFASLFTAPTAATALLGVSESSRRFLNGAARATPYITAVLLYGAAVYLLV
jgi:cytochrome c-type biogenesis protein